MIMWFYQQLKKKYISKNIFKVKNAAEIETHFLWLIKIGVLRREVDGQGLTSKVRLTPLGRLILEDNQNIPNQKASFLELVKHSLYRFFLLPWIYKHQSLILSWYLGLAVEQVSP